MHRRQQHKHHTRTTTAATNSNHHHHHHHSKHDVVTMSGGRCDTGNARTQAEISNNASNTSSSKRSVSYNSYSSSNSV
jgi:hypothetical protein